MTSIFTKNEYGLSMRQTLALGLLAGLSAAAVHALTCNGNPTEYQQSRPGSLPQLILGQATAPTSGTARHALYVEPAPTSPSAEPVTAAGPNEPQPPATLIQRGPALLWRL